MEPSLAVRAVSLQPTSCSAACSSLPLQPPPLLLKGKARFWPLCPERFLADNSHLLTPLAACRESLQIALCNVCFPFSFHTPLWGPLAKIHHLGVSPSLTPPPASAQPGGDILFSQTSRMTEWPLIFMAWDPRNWVFSQRGGFLE